MEFTTRRKKTGLDNVPMINLVFLLLIFFLLTAQITPTALIEVTPPEAASGDAAEQLPAIVMDAEGRVAFEDAFGREAVLERLSAEVSQRCREIDCAADPVKVTLRADAATQARDVAALIAQIGTLGRINLSLATVGR